MRRNSAAAALLSSVCGLISCGGAPPPPPPATPPPAATPAASAAPAAVPFTFLPVAGAWTPSVDDGQPTMTIDGTKATSEAFPLAVVREVPSFQSGKLSMQFKLIGGKSDQIAGLVFNLKPDGSYNFARYNTKDGNVAIWRVVDGKREVLAHGEAHQQLPLNQWHELAVTIDGAKVSVSSANGALTVSHTLAAPVDGRIGLWTKADSVTAFRALTASRP